MTGLLGIHRPPPDIAEDPPYSSVLSMTSGSLPDSLTASAVVIAAEPDPTTTTSTTVSNCSIALLPRSRARRESGHRRPFERTGHRLHRPAPAVHARALGYAHRVNQRRDARRNRARIIAAAAEVFREDGAGAPLNLVAQRADVGPGTLYRHFPDRGALIAAVLEMRMEALEQYAATYPGVDLVEHLLVAICRLQLDAPGLFTAVRATATPQATLEAVVAQAEALLDDALDRARRDGAGPAAGAPPGVAPAAGVRGAVRLATAGGRSPVLSRHGATGRDAGGRAPRRRRRFAWHRPHPRSDRTDARRATMADRWRRGGCRDARCGAVGPDRARECCAGPARPGPRSPRSRRRDPRHRATGPGRRRHCTVRGRRRRARAWRRRFAELHLGQLGGWQTRLDHR